MLIIQPCKYTEIEKLRKQESTVKVTRQTVVELFTKMTHHVRWNDGEERKRGLQVK